jgi:hypothetical protein
LLLLALLAEQLQVIGIHLGDEQRHKRIHAEVARVADHDVAGGGKGALDVARHRRVETREHDLRSTARHASVDNALGGVAGNRRREPPRRH